MSEKICLGYSRVSSDEQAAHGISIDAQRTILEGYAAMTSQQIRIYEDAGFSGKNTSRPALQQLLQACRSEPVSAVVVWKLDRLSRSLRDTLAIIEDVLQPRGITLVSVTESIDTSTPSGRMMLNMLASFAQLEREQDSDRVVMAHKHLARDCKYLGGHVPLGYCIDEKKHYQLDPDTAPVVRHAFEMYMARSGYTPILDYLNSFNFPGTRKTEFKKSDLKFMLKNEIYVGTYIRRLGVDPRHRITSPETIRVPGGVPAILTEEEWQRVCELRSQSERAPGLYSARTIWLLSGLVYCAVCGALMPLNYGGKDRDGTRQRYYRCKASCCRSARLEHIQDAVLSVLESMAVSDADAITKACAIANSFSDAADEDHAAAARAVDQQILELNKRIARIVAFISEQGRSAPVSLADDLRRLEKDRADLQNKANALRRPAARYDAPATVAAIRACADIKNAPPEQQKALLQAAVYKIKVSDEDYKITFNWHLGCGDEPPHPMCQSIQRQRRSRPPPRPLPNRAKKPQRVFPLGRCVMLLPLDQQHIARVGIIQHIVHDQRHHAARRAVTVLAAHPLHHPPGGCAHLGVHHPGCAVQSAVPRISSKAHNPEPGQNSNQANQANDQECHPSVLCHVISLPASGK